MPRRDTALTAILLAIYLVLAVPAFSGLANPDLMAAWAAALAYADGAGPAVYGLHDAPFDTLAPPALHTAFERIGYDEPRYAYIYAPLWLALLAPLTAVSGPEPFLLAATWANNLMLPGMVLLAWRLARRSGPGGTAGLPAPAFLLIGLAALAGGYVGGLALYQNQVQIAVAFLILLAAERTGARAPVAAGLALALAAALKSYPVLLAVIWIGQRDWRALAAFGLGGAALGGLSLALAGWEMHAAFLSQLRQIADTALLTSVTLNLPALAANLGLAGDLTSIFHWNGLPAEVYVAPRPGWLGIASGIGLAAVLLAGWRRAAQGGPAGDPLLWPVLAGAVSLMTPVSWSFHYLATMAALPALIDRFGPWRGGALTATVAGTLSFPAIPLWRAVLPVAEPLQLSGTLAVLVMVVALGWTSGPRQAG